MLIWQLQGNNQSFKTRLGMPFHLTCPIRMMQGCHPGWWTKCKCNLILLFLIYLFNSQWVQHLETLLLAQMDGIVGTGYRLHLNLAFPGEDWKQVWLKLQARKEWGYWIINLVWVRSFQAIMNQSSTCQAQKTIIVDRLKCENVGVGYRKKQWKLFRSQHDPTQLSQWA